MSVLGNIPNTDIYESIDFCQEAQELPAIKILRFEESVFYANVDNFKYKVIKFSELKINEILAKIKRERANRAKLMLEKDTIQVNFTAMNVHTLIEQLCIYVLRKSSKFLFLINVVVSISSLFFKQQQKKQIEKLMKSKGIENAAFNQVCLAIFLRNIITKKQTLPCHPLITPLQSYISFSLIILVIIGCFLN